MSARIHGAAQSAFARVHRISDGIRSAQRGGPVIDRRWQAFPASLSHRSSARFVRDRATAVGAAAGDALRADLGDRRTRIERDGAWAMRVAMLLRFLLNAFDF